MIPFRDNIPSRTTPVLTIGLILLNVVVHVQKASQPELDRRALTYRYGVVPASWAILGQGPQQIEVYDQIVLGPSGLPQRTVGYVELPGTLRAAALPLLTSMFLHASLLHLLGNMWFLWLFGDNVEDRLGKVRFLLLYLLSGVIAALSQVFVDWRETVPMIGASGAVAGVLGAYMVTYPHARVLTFVPFFYFFWPLVELPAVLFLGLWFVLQFLSGTAAAGTAGSGGVAWWAHVGGFLAGIALMKLLAPEPQGRRGPQWAELVD